jgi:aspartate/methionine/tyrosine aminotransferase
MSAFLAAERVRGFGTSIFTEMSALAVEHKAVNLGQGFPDFAGPAWVKQAAAEAIAADLNQYALATGLPRLRAAIAATWVRNGWGDIDPSNEVTVTSGATEALFCAAMAFVNPGDEVICFEPFYDAYLPDIIMAGGVPRVVRLYPPAPAGNERYAAAVQWRFDPDELAAAFTPRTRIFLLNTPHNPTGKVFTRAELEQIAVLCQQHNVIAVTDEVYDQLVYDGAVHVPLATLPGMWERTVTINSTGKTFSLTGWKIGYVVAAPHLSQALRQAHQWITFATATPLQQAAAVALELAPENGYYAELRAAYLERRDLLDQVLRQAGLATLPVEGSYFIMADISNTGFASDADFCRWLTRDVGVAAIPPSSFYANQRDVPLLARFCFAKKLETIQAAAERLAGIDRNRLGG